MCIATREVQYPDFNISLEQTMNIRIPATNCCFQCRPRAQDGKCATVQPHGESSTEAFKIFANLHCSSSWNAMSSPNAIFQTDCAARCFTTRIKPRRLAEPNSTKKISWRSQWRKKKNWTLVGDDRSRIHRTNTSTREQQSCTRWEGNGKAADKRETHILCYINCSFRKQNIFSRFRTLESSSYC